LNPSPSVANEMAFTWTRVAFYRRRFYDFVEPPALLLRIRVGAIRCETSKQLSRLLSFSPLS
jgi:hypothetical protein